MTFEAYDEAGAPRVYVGMFRPPFEEYWEQRSCESGLLWYHKEHVRKAWQEGLADKPLYAVQV